MAERPTTEIQSESPSPNNPFDFLSRIPKFLSQAFGNNHTGNDNEKSAERGDGVEASGTKTKIQNVVRFRKNQSEVPPLKVENEDAVKENNRIILWQIYALGGFIVLKWAWGKWQERKANDKKDSSGEEQPPAPPSDEAANSPPAPLSDEASDSPPPTEPIPAED